MFATGPEPLGMTCYIVGIQKTSVAAQLALDHGVSPQ